jgi:CheY-like chemotaxis protein
LNEDLLSAMFCNNQQHWNKGLLAAYNDANVARVPIVCLEDIPEACDHAYKAIFHELGFEHCVKRHYSEASQLVKKLAGRCIICVDMQLGDDDKNKSLSGVKFIEEMVSEYPWIPVIVYSAYLGGDNYYMEKLASLDVAYGYIDKPFQNDSRVVEIAQNALKRCLPLGDHQYRWRNCEAKWLELDYENFSKGSNEEKMNMRLEFLQKNHSIIEFILNKYHASWLLVCGDQFVMSFSNNNAPKASFLRSLYGEHKLVPVFIERPPLVEEGCGSVYTQSVGDGTYYPKIKLRVNNKIIEDNFDTGSKKTFILESAIQVEFDPDIHQPNTGMHVLGGFQYYSPVEVEIAEARKNGPAGITFDCGIVVDRKKPPLCDIRDAFFGRDLFDLPMKIEIDGGDRKTNVIIGKQKKEE